MFVHAFLVVASGTSLVRITRKVSRVRRLRVVCARRIQARGAESTAITRSHGARVRACVCARFLPRSLGTMYNCCTCHAQGVARKSLARVSYPGRPSPQGIEYSYHAAGAMARVRARAVHLHGINTLYHAVSVYTGMHKTLETLETLALRARVSKPVSAVLYIPVYTSTAWYNLYIYRERGGLQQND